MAGDPRKSLIAVWSRFLRIPNLLTVPGDPIAGFLLVTQGESSLSPCGWAVAASLCFYAAGLILNDLFDMDADRRERPDRPLPSGQIRPLTAVVSALALLGAGGGFCRMLDPRAWRVGFLLALAIVLYDLGLKKIPALGPLTMGACRGLSVWLGASAVPTTESPSPALAAAVAAMAGYIATVTHLARREMAATPIGGERWAPALALAIGFAFVLQSQPFGSISSWLGCSGSFLLAGVVTLTAARGLASASRPERKEIAPQRVPHMIGLFISGLLFIQAGFIMAAGKGLRGILIGMILIGMFPLHRLLDKHFHAS